MIISSSWGLIVLASGYLSRVISIPALSQFLQHLAQHLHTPPSAHSSLAQLATGHQSYVCLHFILRDSFPDLHSRRGLSHLSFQIILLLPLVLHGNAHLIFLNLLFKKKDLWQTVSSMSDWACPGYNFTTRISYSVWNMVGLVTWVMCVNVGVFKIITQPGHLS